ncbi:MAG: hypothetical protein QGF09_13455, partial [Rhodospirillales bacterium]|nr:hypothetical protein [Rhodospirillales bacterium]
MDHFAYRNGALAAEGVGLAALAEEVGTPFYCYSSETLTHHYKVFEDALAGLDSLICYAVKANSNLAVIGTLARLGAGADVVSAGEMRRFGCVPFGTTCWDDLWDDLWQRPMPSPDAAARHTGAGVARRQAHHE